MPNSLPRAGLWPLAVVIVLFGASWPVTKVAVLHGAGPAWFALGRAGFSGLAAMVAVAAAGRLRLPSRADMPALAAVGVLQLAGFFALSHLAVALVPAGPTAVLSNAASVWVVPLSVLLGERMPPRQWVAAGLGIVGVIILVGPSALEWSRPGAVLGYALLLGAALSWALAMLVLRRRPPRMTMLEMLPWAFGIATLVLLPLALSRPVGQWDGAAWAALLFIGLVAGPCGTWCVMQATQLLPVAVSTTGFLGAPAVGLLLSTAWLGETLTPSLLVGAMLILGGVAAAALPGRRRFA